MTGSHYQLLERMYLSAPINRFCRPSIAVSEGRADVTVEVRADFHHPAHALHGSVYFKSLDDAAFFATQSMAADVWILTVDFNLILLEPVVSGLIRATGRLVHSTRSLLVAESELFDAERLMVARGSVTFRRSRSPLDPSMGYQ